MKHIFKWIVYTNEIPGNWSLHKIVSERGVHAHMSRALKIMSGPAHQTKD
jgi:hypothetical protein